MTTDAEHTGEKTLGVTAILIHLGLAACGIAALLTGLLVDDDSAIGALGFALHSWAGMAATSFIVARMALGIVGPAELRFGSWVPCTRERLSLVKEDIIGLLRFRLPHRPPHAGIAGVVETFGLLAFLGTALSGAFLFFTMEPGQEPHGLVHAVKECHEAGVPLVLLFLSMHAGAVVVHALTGRHLWRKMLFLKERRATSDPAGSHVAAAAK